MLTYKMIDNLNEQINKEIYSSYLYLGMESYSLSAGLDGVANWFSIQVQEEIAHAKKFFDYVTQQGGRVILQTIDVPPQNFNSTKDLFMKTLEHEKGVTKRINDLMGYAREENDNATMIFLQWFITEQVEEEASVNEIIQKLELAGVDGNGLFMIDKDLSQRVFTPPQA